MKAINRHLLVQADSVRIPLPDGCVQVVVTSPPYFGLRDYQTSKWDGGDPACDHIRQDKVAASSTSTLGFPAGDGPRCIGPGNSTTVHKQVFRSTCLRCGAVRVDRQIGLEESPDCGRRGAGSCGRCYVCAMVRVFREVKRVLRDDGCTWVNYGDSYTSTGRSDQKASPKGTEGQNIPAMNRKVIWSKERHNNFSWTLPGGLKPKDLCLIPHRVALALQADGWWVRSGLPFIKINPMPESTTDRPTTAHEYLFLLTKSGSPTFWTHRDGKGTRTRPAPDYRWVDRLDGGETAEEPEGWRTEMMPGEAGKAGKEKRWTRVNLWDARDYYYDADAVRAPSASSTLERDKYSRIVQSGNKSYVPDATDHSGLHAPYSVVHDHETPSNPAGRNRRTSDWFLESLDERIAEQRAYLAHLESVRRKGGMLVDEGGDPLAVVLSTEAFKGSHFAVMPRRLVEPCLKASTSQSGACSRCGAPLARMVDRPTISRSGEVPINERDGGLTAQHGIERTGLSYFKYNEWLKDNPPQTIGWTPTCSCPEAANPRPCLCLDPFSGSGTTLVVAEALGLRAIGLDLSREYLAMSKRRLERPHARIAAPAAKDKPMPLFDQLGG